MSAYADGWAQRQYPGIAEKLLWKSATLQVLLVDWPVCLSAWSTGPALSCHLLPTAPISAACPPNQGFFLLNYASEWRRHLTKLAALLQAGRLRMQVHAALLCLPACLHALRT